MCNIPKPAKITFEEKFHVSEVDEMSLTQIYPWDFIVNTGIDSSGVVAQKIIEFIDIC